MKAKTVEQFVIIQHIQNHFNMNAISLNLIDNSTVQVIDRAGVKLDFICVDECVRCRWPEDREEYVL